MSRNLQFYLLNSLLLLRAFIWPDQFPDRKLAHMSCHKPTRKDCITPDNTLTVIKLLLILLCKELNIWKYPSYSNFYAIKTVRWFKSPSRASSLCHRLQAQNCCTLGERLGFSSWFVSLPEL